MRRTFVSFAAAAALLAAGLLAASPAEAAFRVIKWDVTKICQIWDFSLGRPLPHPLSRDDGTEAELRRRPARERSPVAQGPLLDLTLSLG